MEEDTPLPIEWGFKYKTNYIRRYSDNKPFLFTSREDALYFKKNHEIELKRDIEYYYGYPALDQWEVAIYVDKSWITREKERFDTRQYAAPVWSSELWHSIHPLYCHVHPKEPEFVRYTSSPEKGMQRVYTKVKPGKFLKDHVPSLSDGDIKYWANIHKEMYVDGPEVSWAETPEEIVRVYTMPRTFESCMQKPKTSFSSSVHPTYVYGAGELSLAYIVKDNRLMARALVDKVKKKVGRVYGDDTLLRIALKKAGIETTSNNSSYERFYGAKLLKIVDYSNNIVLPYIDGIHKVCEHTDYLTIANSNSDSEKYDLLANNTSGHGTRITKCTICGDTILSHKKYIRKNDETNEEIIGKICNRHVDYLAYDRLTGFYYDPNNNLDFTTVIVDGGKTVQSLTSKLDTTAFIYNDKYYSKELEVPVYDSQYNTITMPSTESHMYFYSTVESRYFLVHLKALVEKIEVSTMYLDKCFKAPNGKYYFTEDTYKEQTFIEYDLFGGIKFEYDLTIGLEAVYDNTTKRPEYASWPIPETLTENQLLYYKNKHFRALFEDAAANTLKEYTVDWIEIAGFVAA